MYKRQIVHPEALFESMEQAYLNKGNKKMRKQARKGAMAYDADLVTRKYWVPLLKEIEENLKNLTVLPEMEMVKFA